MDNNEYTDILDQHGAPAGTDYDKILANDRDVQRSQLQNTMYQAAKVEPDRKADVLRLSDEMKLPPNIVERNYDDLRQKQKVKGVDYDSIIDSTPGLAKFLEDPNKAAVGQDDLQNMQQHEHLVTNARKATSYWEDFRSGFQGSTVGLFMRNKLPDLTLPENAPIADSLVQQLGTLAGDWPAMVAGGIGGASAGAALGTVTLPVIGTVGFGAAGAAAGTFALPAMLKKEMTEELRNGSVKTFPELVTRVKSILTEGGKQGVVGLATAGAGAVAGKAAATIANPLIKTALPVAAEVGAMTVAGKGVEGELPTGRDFLEGGLLVAGLHAAGGAGGAIKNRIDTVASENQTQSMKNFYLAMGSTAEASKLRERLPQMHSEFANQITKDSPVEDIYLPIDAVDTYFQSNKLNPQDVMNQIGAGNAYAEAKATGADVKIPLAQWVSKVVGSEHYKGLANDVKFNPQDLTVNQQAKLKEEVDRQMRELADQQQPNPDQTLEHSAKQVGHTVAQQLDAIGLDPKQAAIYESAFKSLGHRTGVDPLNLFNQFRLRIGNDHPLNQTGDVLNQPARGVSFPVRQAEDGSFSVSPRDDMQAVGRLSGDDFKIDSFSHNEKYNGVAQDMIRSLEHTARGANAKSMSAFETNPDLIKAYEAQGFSVTEKSERGSELSKDLTDRVATHNAHLKQQIEQTFTAHDALDKYAAIPDTDGGRFIDTDTARQIFEPYNQGREGAILHSKATDEPAGRFAAKAFEDRLKSAPEGPAEPALILSGGSASGKTKFRNDFREQLKGLPLILDTTSANYKVAKERIEKTLESGRQVHMTYIYRPFDMAIEGNAKRFQETGRFVDPHYMAYSHVSSIDTFLRLAREYAQNPKVHFEAFDNSKEGRLSPINLDKLNRLRYNKNGESLNQATRRLKNLAEERLKNEQEEIKRTQNAAAEGVVGTQGVQPEASLGSQSQESGNGGSTLDQSRLPDQLNQSSDEGPRGQIQIGDNGINIAILKKADASTFLHETGHFYLKVMDTLASGEDAPAQIKEDFNTIRDWVGAKPGEKFTTEQHETFARGFEAYLMEGKAPSSALRTVFARFRVWLVSVYKQMRNLNVDLTDEVRGVMDRLLATDDEIAHAQGQQNMQELFTDPAKVGLTGDKLERYQRARDEAKQAAQEELSAKLIHDFRREKEAWWKKQHSDIRAGIENDVNQQPIYRALSVIQSGKMADGSPLPEGMPEIKLSKEALVEKYGKDFLKQLPRPYVYSAKNGLHPDIAAELLGFSSGDELVSQMIKAPKKDTYVDSLANQKMAELHPDLLNDGQLPDEAMKAIHNEKRAHLLRLELEHLASNDLPALKDVIRTVAKRVPTEKMVREQATAVVASKAVSDLSPYLYQAAESRSAKEAGEALARGDIDAAFEAKRRELLNHEIYRAVTKAKDNIESQVEFFKRVSGPDDKISKNRDIDLVNAARAILADHGLGKSDRTAESYLAPIKQYDPEAYQTVSALVQSVSQVSGDYRTIKYDDFVAMSDTVKSLWDLARSTRQIEIDGKKMDREVLIDELKNGIGNISEGNKRPGYDKAVSTWDKTKMSLLGIRSALRRVESWVDSVDGGDINGPFRRYIWNPVSEATARYREAKKGVIEKYLEIVKTVEPSLTQKEIKSPELGYTFSGKQELLGALLHTGNESNFQKLIRGRHWGDFDANGNLDTSNWDAFVRRMVSTGVLTKVDYDFAQGVWDLLGTMKPEAQRVHKELYGHYFNEVTAREFQTPFGTYEGGYVPAVADPFVAEDAAIREEKASLEGLNNSFMFPTAGRGFTKSRVEQYARPLTLDLRFVPSHIDKVLRFVHIEPHVREVGRIVMDRSFRSKLEGLDATVGGDMLVPWLQRSALQKIETPSQGWGGRAADTFFRELRRRTGFQVMVGNVVNILHPFAGISTSLLKVEAGSMRDALWTYVRQPKATTSDIMEKSVYMRNLMTESSHDSQRIIDEMLLNPSKYEKARDFATQHGYFFQGAVKHVVDTVVWSAAYNEAIGKAHNELEAVRSADSAVRQTQGSSAPEDVSRFETGSPFMRAFTMFYSYFNMQTNLLGTEFAKTTRELGLKKGAGRLLYTYIFGFMAPAVAREVILHTLSGKSVKSDDDEKTLDGVMDIFFGSQFRAAGGMVPGVGPMVQAGINAFNKKWYDDRISTSPAISMIESAVSAPHAVYQTVTGGGHRKEAIRDTLTLLGLMTGAPIAPLARPLGYLSDISDNKATPTGPIDFTRGLMTGKAGGQN